jgi:hypothetical protein
MHAHEGKSITDSWQITRFTPNMTYSAGNTLFLSTDKRRRASGVLSSRPSSLSPSLVPRCGWYTLSSQVENRHFIILTVGHTPSGIRRSTVGASSFQLSDSKYLRICKRPRAWNGQLSFSTMISCIHFPLQ